MRATWLGSAGLTALVRCACGLRLYLSRPHWRRRGFAICDGCKAVIRYESPEVVNVDEAEELLKMAMRRDEERAELREGLERELRRFVQVYATQPEKLWSPATRRFVAAVRPALELLGGPVRAAEGEWYGAAAEGAYRDEEGERRDRWSVYAADYGDGPPE